MLVQVLFLLLSRVGCFFLAPRVIVLFLGWIFFQRFPFLHKKIASPWTCLGRWSQLSVLDLVPTWIAIWLFLGSVLCFLSLALLWRLRVGLTAYVHVLYCWFCCLILSKIVSFCPILSIYYCQIMNLSAKHLSFTAKKQSKTQITKTAQKNRQELFASSHNNKTRLA